VASQATDLAIKNDCIIEFDFNGTLLQAMPVAKVDRQKQIDKLIEAYHTKK